MMGKELDGLSFKELQHLEHLLSEGILSVKDKKEQVLVEQLEKSRMHVIFLSTYLNLATPSPKPNVFNVL